MTPPDDIRVVVIDDHDLFRRGLRELLEEQGLRVVGEASDGAEGIRLALHVLPDVVVVDLNMPGLSGGEVTQRLSAAAPTIRVLVLTISAGDAEVLAAIEAGACGYLLKDASITEIAFGVRSAAAGESLISPRIASRLLDRLRPDLTDAPTEVGQLSERELEVLRLVAQGRENQEIAAALVISPRTAKNHISSILTKLQMENRVQAAVYAVRRGLAD